MNGFLIEIKKRHTTRNLFLGDVVVRRLLLCFLLFSLSFKTSLATHSVGFDLRYECMGGNLYRFTLNFYRDCEGLEAPISPTIYLSSASCGINKWVNLHLQGASEIMQTYCDSPAYRTTCDNPPGTRPGIERYVYTSSAELPPCSDWVVYFQYCCRNNAITNLNDPGNNNMYAALTLNNTSGCNNSPSFGVLPVPYVCVNQPFTYNHGAVDADGDSLVYTLIYSRTDSATNVPFISGYSLSSPLSASGFTFNNSNGQIAFTPTMVQQAVVSVQVDEYRNGVKIGSATRDLQIVVVDDCPVVPNIPPVLSIPGIFNNTIHLSTCKRECFEIMVSDINGINYIELNDLPPGVETYAFDPVRGSMTFCWMPDIQDIGIFEFSAVAADNGCPYILRSVKTYTIIITPGSTPAVDAGIGGTICTENNIQLNGNGPSNATLTWSPSIDLSNDSISNPVASPHQTTLYTLTATTPDGCTSSDTVSVTVLSPDVRVYPKYKEVCYGSSVVVNVNAPVGASILWSASLSDTTITGGNTITLPSLLPDTGSLLIDTVTVMVTDQTGCVNADTSIIKYGAPPPAQVCNNIYVTPNGTGSGLSQNDPTDIRTGIAMAECSNATVKMGIGTYVIDSPLRLGSLMTLEGGFDHNNNWVKTSLAGATTIFRSNKNPEGQIDTVFCSSGAIGFSGGLFTDSIVINGISDVITNLSISVNITHPCISDIYINYSSPVTNGSPPLYDKDCGRGQYAGLGCVSNMNAIFDDSGDFLTCPPTGTFVPSYPLQNLIGENIDGTWKIKISNNGSAGTLNQWCLHATLGAKRFTAIEADNASFFRLQDLTIETADADTIGTAREGISTYGVHMSNCSNYEIVRCVIKSGKAKNGADGNTIGGFGSSLYSTYDQPALGSPQADSCDVTTDPGNNGHQGRCSWSFFIPQSGQGGQGVDLDTICINGCGITGQNGYDGEPGENGFVGTPDHSPGSAVYFSSQAAYYVPKKPVCGGDGCLGGGGGGGSGAVIGTCCQVDCSGDCGLPTDSANGGRGGLGGAGGLGGRGGYGGGSSVSVYINACGNSGLIQDCYLIPGTAGIGGAGGEGQDGEPGMPGEQGGTHARCGVVYQGGNGGAGGDGGKGGRGKDGSHGISAKIAVTNGNSPEIRNGNSVFSIAQGYFNSSTFDFLLSLQPVINISNEDCANKPVSFSSAVSGFWHFDYRSNPSSANPATASGTSAVAEYNATGRKTITDTSSNPGNFYTGFKNIAIDPSAYVPEITTDAEQIGQDEYKICLGEAVNFFTSTPAITYSWSMSGGVSPLGYSTKDVQNLSFNPVGTYVIKLNIETDCCGWSLPDSIILHVFENNIIVNSDATICRGENVTLTASGASSFIWAPATGLSSATGNTVIAQPAATTTYTAVSTDSDNCGAGFAEVTVTVNDSPSLTMSSNTASCGGDGTATVAAAGGSGNYGFFWNTSPSQSSATAVGLSSGNYRVIVTDNITGCLDSASAFVAETWSAYISRSRNVSCPGSSDGWAVAAGYGGVPPYSFIWSTGATIDSVGGLSPGDYYVIVTDAAGCADYLDFTIAEPEQLHVIFADTVNPLCADSSGSATALADGGNGPPFNYSWNTIPPQSSATAIGLSAGTYSVTITDHNGCTATDVVTLVAEGVTVQIDVDTSICPGDSLFIAGLWRFVSGGYYEIPGAGCDTVIATTLTVIDCDDSDACTDDICAAAVCNYIPLICNDNDQCTVDGCDLITGCAFTLLLCDDNNFCTNDTCDVANGCIYNPIICDDNDGCTVDTCYTSTGCEYAPTMICNDNNSCTTDGCDLIGGCVYTPLSCNDNDTCTNDICNIVTGCAYTTIVCNDNNACTADGCNPAIGCEFTAIICNDSDACTSDSCGSATGCDFTRIPIDVFIYPPFDTIKKGENTILTGSIIPDSLSFSWTPSQGLSCDNCLNPMASPDTNTVYKLIATDINGCSDTAGTLIVVIPIESACSSLTVYVPNAFSPNGDMVNDVFYAYGNGIAEMHLRIFNRWGDFIFESYNTNNGWDGTHKGKLLSPDVFVYYLSVTFCDGSSLPASSAYRKGSVTLLR